MPSHPTTHHKNTHSMTPSVFVYLLKLAMCPPILQHNTKTPTTAFRLRVEDRQVSSHILQHNNSHTAFRLRVEDSQVSSHILQHNNSHTAFRLRVEDSQVSSHILQHNSHTAFRLRVEVDQVPQLRSYNTT